MGTTGIPTRATIYDVAKRAGVSHQTVARYLRDPERVKRANRDRIAEAVQHLNYHANNLARALRVSRTFRLGAIGYSVSGSGPGLSLSGASEAARERGYFLDQLVLSPYRKEELATAIELLRRQGVEGFLSTAPIVGMSDTIKELVGGLPLVIDEGSLDEATGRSIGTTATLNHLLELGHRDIVHLAGPRTWLAARARRNAYEQGMKESGLTPRVIEAESWSASSGYQSLTGWSARQPMTALMAANDRLAIGALRRLRERGLHVPRDVSLTGYDDISEAGYIYPPLTTVSIDFHGEGRRSVTRLIDLIEGAASQLSPLRPALLRIRDSTARPLSG